MLKIIKKYMVNLYDNRMDCIVNNCFPNTIIIANSLATYRKKTLSYFLKTIRCVFVLCTLMSFFVSDLIAQTNTNSKNMIWNVKRIVQFVEWPETKWQNNEFVIGVINGNDYQTGFYDKLSKISIDNKLTKVKEFRTINELTYCHILFISEATTMQIEDILQFTKHKPILTIANTPEFLLQGAIVNFMELSDTQIPFVVNEKALKQSGLYIDALLLSNVKIINPLKSRQ